MTYLATVLADNPVHYWRLADPPGAIANDIGTGLPFPMYVQSANAGCLGYSGPNADGGSAVFDANNWLTTFAGVHFVPPVTWEWTLWFDGQKYDAQQVFPMGWGDSGNGPFHNCQASGIFALNFGGAASVSVASPPAHQWSHFAFTYAGGAVAFSYYMNGVAQPAPGAVNVAAFFGGHLVGRRITGGGQWLGAISEVAIYTSVLSGSQIAAHAAAIENPTAPPVALATGGLGGGGGTNSLYLGILQQILQSVRTTYQS